MPARGRKRRASGGRSHNRQARSRELAARARDEEAGELGVLVAHYGVAVDVRLDSPGAPNPGETNAGETSPGEPGPDQPELRSVRVRRRSGHVVGDRVELVGERLRRLPRSSQLRRRDAMGRTHVVAANLDLLGIVVAPVPPSPAAFIDRALVSARACGISAALIVNKVDLPEAEALMAELRATYLEGPGALDLPLLGVAAADGSGLAALRAVFAGHGELGAKARRGAFVGTSGVGKSSLVNALLPELDLAVGAINRISGLGRHTTTTATLHPLPEGGELIDTPGFRDFGLVDISVRELAEHFPGFAELRARHPERRCRFNDCRHLVEPDCAIVAAVDAGELPAASLARYRSLLAEVTALEGSR